MVPKALRHDTVRLLLWDFSKDRVLVPPLPRDLVELRKQIIGAFAAVTGDIVIRVSEDMEYRPDSVASRSVDILSVCKVC